MREVIHFNSTAERLRYLKNGLEEIIPKVAEEAPAEAEEKPKKKAKKGKKADEVQAE